MDIKVTEFNLYYSNWVTDRWVKMGSLKYRYIVQRRRLYKEDYSLKSRNECITLLKLTQINFVQLKQPVLKTTHPSNKFHGSGHEMVLEGHLLSDCFEVGKAVTEAMGQKVAYCDVE